MCKPNNSYLYYTAIAALVAAMAFSKPHLSKTNVTIKIQHYVGDARLRLDSGTYNNALGQPYTVSMFKYYISHIKLVYKDGKVFTSGQHFLVNEEDTASKNLVLNDVQEGEYTSMEFVIGVDSAHNCSGIQTGSLDPALGMFWAWNTGYIFLKMEGRSAASAMQGHTVEYHIGGYKYPNNCIRTVVLPINLVVDNANRTNTIHIKADISRLLSSKTIVDFKKMPSVTDFHNATTIADNYMQMFSVQP